VSVFEFLTRSLLILTLLSPTLLGASVSLAWDPNTENDLAGYWVYRTQTSGSNYIRVNSSLQVSASFVDSTVEAGKTYYYMVTAVNTAGLESPPSNEVKAVIPANAPPLANAGPDQVVAPGTVVTLQCRSTDPDGDPLARSWLQVAGPPVSLSGRGNVTATFAAPPVATTAKLVFRLTVDDGKGGSASDDVIIRINPSGFNRAPTANAGPDRTVIPGNTVRLVGYGKDPDDDPITFSWSQTSGPAVSLSGANNATLTFAVPDALDGASLTFQLTVIDNKGAQATDEVAVRVTSTHTGLVVPASLNGTGLDDAFIGVAVLNTSSQSNTLHFATVDRHGGERLLQSAEFRPQAQEAFLTAEVVKNNMEAVSLRAQAQQGEARGFFMIGRGQPHQMDGVGGEPVEAKELFFPVARHQGTRQTLYFLTNPQFDMPARITLEVVDQAGSVVRSGNLDLAPGASNLASLSTLLGIGNTDGEHYLRVTSDVPVQGFELMTSPDDFSSAGGQSRMPAQTLWIPHYLLGRNGEDTELRLINPGNEAVDLTLWIYDHNALLVDTHSLSITGRGLAVARLSDVLGVGAVPSQELYLTGHIVVEVDSTGVPASLLGSATFSGPNAKAQSTLPMWRAPQTETVYLQVAQSTAAELFTGLAVMNPNNTPVSVTVRAWDKDGRQSGEKTIRVAPGERIVDLLGGPALFGPSFEQIGGHLKVSSDQPVVSFVVFGDSQSEFLAAVEGQPGTN